MIMTSVIEQKFFSYLESHKIVSVYVRSQISLSSVFLLCPAQPLTLSCVAKTGGHV